MGFENLENNDEKIIPPQYEGLSSEIVEDLWVDPIYVDEEKNKEAKRRRDAALAEIRRKEELAKVRSELGMDEEKGSKYEGVEDADFEEFTVKNGETDEGVFWNEFRNRAAKKLKESGEFEWGKERIYFDIPTQDMEILGNIIMDIARAKKIPVAFKYLDVDQTHKVNLQEGNETTRFVANFVSVDDAKRLYAELSNNETYTSMESDRSLDYGGHNIDGLAHYASGYRERRRSLSNMINTAVNNGNGTYTYTAVVDGYSGEKINKKVVIPAESFEILKKQYEDMPDPEEVWNS